jgi:hypothetical protein
VILGILGGEKIKAAKLHNTASSDYRTALSNNLIVCASVSNSAITPIGNVH